jgi:hypothetical protein
VHRPHQLPTSPPHNPTARLHHQTDACICLWGSWIRDNRRDRTTYCCTDRVASNLHGHDTIVSPMARAGLLKELTATQAADVVGAHVVLRGTLAHKLHQLPVSQPHNPHRIPQAYISHTRHAATTGCHTKPLETLQCKTLLTKCNEPPDGGVTANRSCDCKHL